MSNTTIRNTIAGAILALSLLSTPGMASQVNTSNPAFAPMGGMTSIPVGHADFCKSHRSECGPNARVVEMVALDQGLWQQLLDINARYNAEIVPVTDDDLYQVAEYWTYPNGYGDCEDIALAKRRELIAKGWPASTLLMTVATGPAGGHAMLTVRTDRGDLVLDNLEGDVRIWNDTRYRFIKRQSQTDQGRWVDILDARDSVVAAR